MKNKIFSLLTVLVLILALSGCAANQNTTGGNSTPSPTGNGNSAINSNTDNITAEQAEQAALTHAGITSAEAEFKRTELEFDDGIYKYEIEFYVGTTEYDYEVNAETGEIISFDKDID